MPEKNVYVLYLHYKNLPAIQYSFHLGTDLGVAQELAEEYAHHYKHHQTNRLPEYVHIDNGIDVYSYDTTSAKWEDHEATKIFG